MTLHLKNISKSYIEGKKQKFLFKDITISIGNHGLIGIVGPSGCGKSTLLNIISMLTKADGGHIEVQGIEVGKNAMETVSFRRNNIATIYQYYNLVASLNVRENVEYGLYCKHRKPSKKEYFEKLCKKLEIDTILTKHPCQLSGGQKQRVAIARAMLCDMPILLCDEPTGALNEELSNVVMKILKEYAKNHIVIIVSHNNLLLEAYTTDIIDFNNLQSNYVFNDTPYGSLVKNHQYINNYRSAIYKGICNFFYEKNITRYLLLLQAIVLSLFVLLFSVQSGVLSHFEKMYEQDSIKNYTYIQKTSPINPGFTDLEVQELKEDYIVHPVYNLEQGILNNDKDLLVSYFPVPTYQDHVIIEGNYPQKPNEVAVNSLFVKNHQVTIGSMLSYQIDGQEYQLVICGIIKSDLYNNLEIYYVEPLLEKTLKDKASNHTSYIIESDKSSNVISKYNVDGYYSYNLHMQVVEGQSTLINIASIVMYIFLGISFFLCMLLVSIVLSTLFYKRRYDYALGISFGISKRFIHTQCFIEGALIGFIMAILGCFFGFIVILILKLTNISTMFVEITPLFSYLPILIYINIIIVYVVICALIAYFVSRKATNIDVVKLLREE